MGEFRGEEASEVYCDTAVEINTLCLVLIGHLYHLEHTMGQPTHEEVCDMIYAKEAMEKILADYFGL